MSGTNLLVRYAVRLTRREWRRFVLPTLSLLITAAVLSGTLFLAAASQQLLSDQARTLLGGDVVLESTTPIVLEEVLEGIVPSEQAEVLEFSSTMQSELSATAVSMQVVSESYPLLGEMGVQEGVYQHPRADELYLDSKGAERLGVAVGDTVRFGEAEFTLAGIIASDPTSLFSNFRFLPRALMSQEGFARARIDPTLLRAEYEYALVIPGMTREEASLLRGIEQTSNGFIQARLASDGGGLAAGLGVVRDFLVVAVLVTAILAAVNVYASTLYFITAERKSFAILLSLGFTRQKLLGVIAITLALIVMMAAVLGVLAGYGLFSLTAAYIATALAITLPTPPLVLYAFLTLLLLGALVVSAFVPTVSTILGLNPKQLLIGEEPGLKGRGVWPLLIMTLCTFLPILALSAFLLESIVRGGVVVGSVIAVYVVVVALFSGILAALYRVRQYLPFTVRSIIAQKKADGLFGTVSFTSLFVALGALATLVLTQATLETYLTEDLATTVPSTYAIDIQPSQKPILEERFPELTLFSNTPARLLFIDGVDIQGSIAAGDTEVDRELGREFNLTARSELLASEAVVGGTWHEGRKGELSVDESFADRAGISLGSEVVFGIQGFEVSGTVTSIRTTDSRSGLPFFFFVLSPEDLAEFPQIYFGYAYQSPAEQQALIRFLASDMPNVTVIETEAIAPLLLALTELLLLIIFVVTIPPLLIAVLLIVTMIVSSYAARRREGGRLRALGATKATMTRWYLLETVSLSFVAALLAYGVGVVTAALVSTRFLEVDAIVWFDTTLLVGYVVIVLLTASVGAVLVKSDTMPLRELLSYGER